MGMSAVSFLSSILRDWVLSSRSGLFETLSLNAGSHSNNYFELTALNARIEMLTIYTCGEWVTHRDRATFGDDCDEWRPERWLCDAKERKQMEAALLTVRRPPLISTCHLMH